jgi:ribosomal protein S18 acetylase RimI-like enzyme
METRDRIVRPEARGQTVTRRGVDAAIEVVPCRRGDRPQLFALALAVFGHTPGWSDERVIGVLRSAVVFIARDERRLVGYVALERDDDDEIVIEQVLVASGEERRGIGHRLLARAADFAVAERAHALRVVVEEGNWRARDFYRRSGFVPNGREVFERVLPRA